MKTRFQTIVISVGLVTAIFAVVACAQGKVANDARREVAITFDDLPASYGELERMSYVTRQLLRSIKSNKVPAIGFVNEFKLYRPGEIDERTALLRMWLDAGLELGNHSFSHVFIDQVPLAAYEEDVIRGETVTRILLREKSMKLRYYPHTQLRTGPTPEYKSGLERFLVMRGYTIAPVTLDNNEYMFAALYGDAKERGDRDTMKRVADAYIPYMEKVFDFFEKLSVDTLGYEVKQILLLHANDINADYFDDLVIMMKRRGYTFISLEEALKDKAYSLSDAQVTKGLSWIHRWRLAKGQQMKPEPGEPEFIRKLFEVRQRRANAEQLLQTRRPAAKMAHLCFAGVCATAASEPGAKPSARLSLARRVILKK